MSPDEQRFSDTMDEEYANRLRRISEAPWKQALDVQRPFRWNLRRLKLGRVLDVGCGIGRNLKALGADSVGVDHNTRCVELAVERGLRAYTVEQFLGSSHARFESFDCVLLSHILEHLDQPASDAVVAAYLPYLRSGGRVVALTPQESGFKTDRTHIRFVGFREFEEQAGRLGLRFVKGFSFPFPRWAGKFFRYNEFVMIAHKL